MASNINCASCGKNAQEASWHGLVTGACCHYTEYCPYCTAHRAWCKCSFGRYVATLPSMALQWYAVALYYLRRDNVPMERAIAYTAYRELDWCPRIRHSVDRFISYDRVADGALDDVEIGALQDVAPLAVTA